MYEHGVERNGVLISFTSGNDLVTTTKFERYLCRMTTPLGSKEVKEPPSPSYKCFRVIENEDI